MKMWKKSLLELKPPPIFKHKPVSFNFNTLLLRIYHFFLITLWLNSQKCQPLPPPLTSQTCPDTLVVLSCDSGEDRNMAQAWSRTLSWFSFGKQWLVRKRWTLKGFIHSLDDEEGLRVSKNTRISIQMTDQLYTIQHIRPNGATCTMTGGPDWTEHDWD